MGLILWRGEDHFFFQYRDANTSDQFRDEVEHHRSHHPQCRSEDCRQQPEGYEVAEQRRSVKREALPPEGLEEVLDIVNGAGAIGDTPQQSNCNERNHEEYEMEDYSNFEHAPYIDVTNHPSDPSHSWATTTARCWWQGRGTHESLSSV
jgi:hypothetical protein